MSNHAQQPAKAAYDALSGVIHFKANLPHVATAPQSDQAFSEALSDQTKDIASDRKYPTMVGIAQSLYGSLLGQTGWMSRLINGVGDLVRSPQGRFSLVCAAADWASADDPEALADVLEHDLEARENLELLQRNLKAALEVVQLREDEREAERWAAVEAAEEADADEQAAA